MLKEVYNYTEGRMCTEQMQCEKDNTCRQQQMEICSLALLILRTLAHIVC